MNVLPSRFVRLCCIVDRPIFLGHHSDRRQVVVTLSSTSIRPVQLIFIVRSLLLLSQVSNYVQVFEVNFYYFLYVRSFILFVLVFILIFRQL